MNNIVVILSLIYLIFQNSPDKVITQKTKEYAIHLDENGSIHIAYTLDYNLYYTTSANDGNTFTQPVLIDKGINYKYSSPAISTNQEHVLIAAAYNKNALSWRKRNKENEWEKSMVINDLDGIVTEQLISIAGGRNDLFYAAWIDERQKGSFALAGTYTIDGGMTWAKSKQLYHSPDGSICPCCRPCVSVWQDSVYLMFRNDVNGNRNMYLLFSDDEGITFNQPLKLGLGTWQINGCPVDGGAITIDTKGNVTTAWKRSNEVFTATPGKPEQKIGTGRMPKIATAKDGNYLTWQYDGEIIVQTPDKKTINLGTGVKPEIIASSNSTNVYAFWMDSTDRLTMRKIK